MVIMAALVLIIRGVYGFRKGALDIRGIGLGFLPRLITLAINGVVGLDCWKVLLWV